jgi:hypothetical protein
MVHPMRAAMQHITGLAAACGYFAVNTFANLNQCVIERYTV